MSPRRGRRILEDRTYHVTHRCYNREFRFKFAVDRDMYRQRLFEMSRKYLVDVLDYMITSNHVHLLLVARTPDELSEAMRFLQGAAAQDYNRRKERSGAFWSGRYHSTLIQDGCHLSRCMFYIGMNMVRNKVVGHPSSWKWSGYNEMTGKRERYKIVNLEILLKRLAVAPDDIDGFRRWYLRTVEEKVSAGNLCCEPFWSESVAVGDRDWIQKIADHLPSGQVDIKKISYEYGKKSKSQRISLVSELSRPSYVLSAGKRAASGLTRVL